MRDQALGVAKIVGDVDQLEPVQRLECRPLAGLEVEGDDAARPRHLLHRELVLRMVAAAGIEHARDGGMAGQRVGHLRGIGAMAVDAQAQRLHALDQHPGVERAERRAGVADDGLQLLEDELLGAEDRAAQGAALAIDVLGGGVDDDVGAPFERPLQHRRGEGVVEHDLGAGLVRHVAHRPDVDDVEHRVGRRFEQHGLRRPRQRLLPR